MSCFSSGLYVGFDAHGSSDCGFGQTAGAQDPRHDDCKDWFKNGPVSYSCLHYGVGAGVLIGLISPQSGPSHRALDEIVVVVG